mgnify:FL=1
MGEYIRRRLALFLPTLIGMTILSFALGFASPSDPALVVLTMDGTSAPTMEELTAKRRELGLDQPYAVQYMKWLGGVVTGDWGVSFVSGKGVWEELSTALPVTLAVAMLAFLWAFLFSIFLGVVMAVYKYRWPDRLLLLFSMALTSLPGFWLAIVAMQLLCEEWHIFPTSGYGSLRHLFLPSAVLAAGTIGAVMRLERDALSEVLEKNYILTARAKGLPFFYVVYKHALKNSLLPIVTMLGNYFGGLLGGAAVIELIFSLPGLGTLVLNAVQARDYPLIQGYVLLVGSLVIGINLFVDVLYAFINPRLRSGGEAHG